MAKPMANVAMSSDTHPRTPNSYTGMNMPARATIVAKSYNAGQQGRMGTTMSMSLGNQMGQPKGI